MNLSFCETCIAVCLSFNIAVCYHFNCNILSRKAFKDYFLKGVGKVRMIIKSYLKCNFMVISYYSPEVGFWNCCGLWGNLWGITEKKVLKHDSLAQLLLCLHWNEFPASGTSLIILLLSLSNYIKRNIPILKYCYVRQKLLESRELKGFCLNSQNQNIRVCTNTYSKRQPKCPMQWLQWQASWLIFFLVFHLELFYFLEKIVLKCPKREMVIQFCGYWNYFQVSMKFRW